MFGDKGVIDYSQSLFSLYAQKGNKVIAVFPYAPSDPTLNFPDVPDEILESAIFVSGLALGFNARAQGSFCNETLNPWWEKMVQASAMGVFDSGPNFPVCFQADLRNKYMPAFKAASEKIVSEFKTRQGKNFLNTINPSCC